MKVSPVTAQGSGSTNFAGMSLNNNGISPDRIAAAKAAMLGQTKVKESETPVDPLIKAKEDSIRTIRMNTNHSPDREILQPEAMQSATGEANETPVVEETKPISPQFAALARQRRALQVKERELAQREQALKTQNPSDGQGDLVAKLKDQPLSVLRDQGLLTPEFYNQLTEYLVSNGQSSFTPEQVQALIDKKVTEAMQGVDKRFQTNEAQAEESALTEILYEVENLAKDESYDLINRKNAHEKVIRHIYDTYKKTGRVLDTKEAMSFVESELEKEADSYFQSPKLKSKYAPAPNPMQAARPQQQMRTLTNRDTAAPSLDRRTRAMQAALGILKR